MDAIWKVVSDPAWWFTAIVVGLIIGVVAARLDRLLTQGASRWQGKFRQWLEKRAAHREMQVSRLAVSFEFLMLDYQRLADMRSSCLLVLLLLVFIGALHATLPTEVQPQLRPLFLVIIAVVYTVFILMAYFHVRALSIARDATHRFQLERGFFKDAGSQ